MEIKYTFYNSDKYKYISNYKKFLIGNDKFCIFGILTSQNKNINNHILLILIENPDYVYYNDKTVIYYNKYKSYSFETDVKMDEINSDFLMEMYNSYKNYDFISDKQINYLQLVIETTEFYKIIPRLLELVISSKKIPLEEINNDKYTRFPSINDLIIKYYFNNS